MRPLEIAILALLPLALLEPLLSARLAPRWRALLPSLLPLGTGAHLLAEGYRWQMLLAYLLAALLWLLALPRLLRERACRAPAWRALGLGLLAVLASLAAAAPPLIFPVPRLPPPAARLGRTVSIGFGLTWPATKRIPTRWATSARSMVQIWYPAEPAAGAQPAE